MALDWVARVLQLPTARRLGVNIWGRNPEGVHGLMCGERLGSDQSA